MPVLSNHEEFCPHLGASSPPPISALIHSSLLQAVRQSLCFSGFLWGFGCFSHTPASPEAPGQRGYTISWRWIGFLAAWAPTPNRRGEDQLEPSALSCRWLSCPAHAREEGEMRPPRLRFSPRLSPQLLALLVTSNKEGRGCLLCTQRPAGTALSALSSLLAQTEDLIGRQCLGVLQGRRHIYFSAAL